MVVLMAYEIEEIKQSQKVYYYLIEHRELREEEEQELYKSYVENESIMNLVKSQGEISNCEIVRYSNVIYIIPKEDNNFLGFSKPQLKAILCRSGATDKDYYLSQFVILTLLVEFYDGQGSTSKSRDYIRVGELLNCISEKLREGADRTELEEQEEMGIAYTNMLEAFEALRSEERGSKAKTTKEGFMHTILSFLSKQGLIDYVEQDEMIKTTKKLDHFMDYNLLNKSNFNRIRQVLGVMDNE